MAIAHPTHTVDPRLRRLLANLASASVVMLALVLVSGCDDLAYRPGRGPVRTQVDDGMPDWVNNPPLDGRVVIGVGADVQHDQSRAFADATQDIARQLHIIITGPGLQSDGANGEYDAHANGGSDLPTVKVDTGELPTLTITKRSDTARCLYVQVSLDRDAWAASLHQSLADQDRQIVAITAQPLTAGDRPIATAARRYRTLLPLIMSRDETARHLQIADPADQIPPAPMTLSSLHEQFSQVLEQVSVEITANPELDAIMPQLAGSCANLGLHLANGLPNPSLRLRLSLQTTAQQIDGVQRLDGSFDAVTILAKDGEEIGSIHIDLRSSGELETKARDRLMAKILSSWNDYLEHGFVDCLTHL